VPGSTRIVNCDDCDNRGTIACPRCKGEGRVVVTRTAAGAAEPAAATTRVSARRAAAPQSAASTAAPPPIEQVTVQCTECAGRGGATCARCSGAGRLVQQSTFHWHRKAVLLRDHDDLPEIDEARLAATCRAEVVYQQRQSGGLRPEWALVPVLSDLVEQAQQRTDADTRIALSEVTISFIPITSVVFDLGKTDARHLYKLFIYGFERYIPSDWRFLDWEKLTSFLAVTLFFILTMIMALFTLL
jgi:eukaryotic-like serine/threonine-protein kinase